MKTGRPELDASIKVATIPAGEPVFVLRGQDALAADAVRAWAALAHARGVPCAVVEQALAQADLMEAWGSHKLPDADHLPAVERQALEYSFGRRAWRAQDHSADPRIMLAEERAIADALGRVRPLLQGLFARGAWIDEATFSYGRPRTEHGRLITEPCPIEGLRRLEATLREGRR